MEFSALLRRFAASVQANDGEGLAGLFAPDGVYDDGFFGPHRGRPDIARMLQRFHDGGRDYWWEFLAPVYDGTDGYAQWRFSYASRLEGCEGRPVLFEGMSRFTLSDGGIVLYREMFDRGLALGAARLRAGTAGAHPGARGGGAERAAGKPRASGPLHPVKVAKTSSSAFI